MSFQVPFTEEGRELNPSELMQSLSKPCHGIKYSHEVQPDSSRVQLVLAASRKVKIMANEMCHGQDFFTSLCLAVVKGT